MQASDRCGAADAVDRQAGVALKGPQGVVGGRAHHPVDASGVESQRAQASLEIHHVVAAQIGRTQVQQAITEPVTSLDEAGPGLPTAYPVGHEAASLLKGPDGRLGFGAENAVFAGDRQTLGEKSPLEVDDCGAARPEL
jgi:hypothetical protein